MEKRYQIFISSTFHDLIDERQAVLKAILEMDHMPAGMELFPASDDSAWQLIQDVIDSSDYYILIVGGRYGSLDGEGIGFTEKEYDYAISAKKPVIPLLHKNPDNLPRGKTETNTEYWEKLKKFRKKVEENHTCVYWVNSDELKSRVIIGLTSTIKRHPGAGWVRADQVPNDATLSEILSLRQKIAGLEAEIAKEKTAPPKGTEDLEQGNDTFTFSVRFSARPKGEQLYFTDDTYTGHFKLTWNQIFAGVAPTFINEASDGDVNRNFQRHLVARAHDAFDSNEEFEGKDLFSFSFSQEEIETCLVQLRALGLIKENQKPRSVSDTKTYWTLTAYGDYLMVQLRALRRNNSHLPDTTGELAESSADKNGED